jgi:hypothetical protein
MSEICGGGDLFVVDTEYLSMGGTLESHRNFLSEIIEDYLHVTAYLCENLSGAYIDSLRDYRSKFVGLPGKIVEAGSYWKWDCEQFVKDIDAADEFLYGT